MFSLSRPLEKTYESAGFPLRSLGRPLGWSVGLHVLVLGALAGLTLPSEVGVAPAAPLQASLRVPAAEVVAATAPPPAPENTPRKPVIALVPVRDAVPPALTFTDAAPTPPPASRVAPETPATTPAAAAVAPGGVPGLQDRSRPVTVALAPQGEARGPDAAGLRLYRLALASEARQFRRYPEAARREGMVGTAEVRISVGAGTLRKAELARSSGHAVLDSAALDMLRAAAARALLPDSLRGQEFAVLLPVVFEVEE